MLELNILEKLTKVTELLSKIKRYFIGFEIYINPEFEVCTLHVKVYRFDIYGEEKDIILYAINEEIDLTKSAAEQNLDYLIKNIEELIDIQTNSSTTKNQ